MHFIVHAVLFTTVILDHCLVGAQSPQETFWKSPNETANTLETFIQGHVLDIKWCGKEIQRVIDLYDNLVELYVQSTCSRSWEKKIQENINITTTEHISWQVDVPEESISTSDATFYLCFRGQDLNTLGNGDECLHPSPEFEILPPSKLIVQNPRGPPPIPSVYWVSDEPPPEFLPGANAKSKLNGRRSSWVLRPSLNADICVRIAALALFILCGVVYFARRARRRPLKIILGAFNGKFPRDTEVTYGDRARML